MRGNYEVPIPESRSEVSEPRCGRCGYVRSVHDEVHPQHDFASPNEPRLVQSAPPEVIETPPSDLRLPSDYIEEQVYRRSVEIKDRAILKYVEGLEDKIALLTAQLEAANPLGRSPDSNTENKND